jgi:acyl-coenzyme A synthetase/AMP-(fatty) acid ligase
MPLDKKGFFTTGDRAGITKGGFELFGRVDNVVKVGGNRVELEAVEDKIKSLNQIKDAYVFQVGSKPGRENDIAAVIVSESDIRELKKLFRKKLTPIEMPRHIKKVDEIPVTPAGKRDKHVAEKLLSD